MTDESGNQEIKDYLLGTLDAERRSVLEDKILWDPAVYEKLLAVEEELIDHYTRGVLSKTERRQFEAHFLVTAERQKNLRFGALLNKYMNSHPAIAPESKAVRHTENTAPAPESPPSSLVSFGRRRAFVFSAVIVACVGMIVLGWVVATKIF